MKFYELMYVVHPALQAGRLEDQRAALPTENPRNGTAHAPVQKDPK